MHVLVDYDGTITDLDTFDALVNEFAGREVWERLDRELHAGAVTLREALAAQAGVLRCSFEEADAFIEKNVAFDPSFAHFVRRCERERVPVAIVSSGLGPLIERALERNALAHIPLAANGAVAHSAGWHMKFRDESQYGHDKAAAVRELRDRGERVVFIGDGISDYSAALEASVVFAKRGRGLERYLQERGVHFTSFESFAEIEAALFGHNTGAMYDKDAETTDRGSTDREELDRIEQSKKQQGEELDQPPAPGKNA
jgi:2,3-diketo-5-methylthio-1-phosphopentane phosphatase